MTMTVNSRTILHQGRTFDLVQENVTLENGVTTDTDFVVHPGAAAIIAMVDESSILLLKQYRHALREYIWEIPAGKLDPQESMLKCAQRELIEETGYAADQWQKLGAIAPIPSYSDERIYIYLATDLAPTARDLDMDEIIDVHEVKFDKALEMIKRGEIHDAKSIVGIYLAHCRLSGKNAG